LQSRAKVLGVQLEIDSKVGEGVKIFVEVPLVDMKTKLRV
jgi:signal transduction histidine kinase